MKYCEKCGTELLDEAVICVGCGCEVVPKNTQSANTLNQDPQKMLNTLSSRLNTNGIIWIVIGALQILGGIFINWALLIVGVLNIISSVQDMNYSKELLQNQNGIVAKFEPLTGPIITLVYNLIFGGVIGVVGSIYYFFAIRNYVMENKSFFLSLETE